jgi:hypothetical protein
MLMLAAEMLMLLTCINILILGALAADLPAFLTMSWNLMPALTVNVLGSKRSA